jgi:hypothetical protein
MRACIGGAFLDARCRCRRTRSDTSSPTNRLTPFQLLPVLVHQRRRVRFPPLPIEVARRLESNPLLRRRGSHEGPNRFLSDGLWGTVTAWGSTPRALGEPLRWSQSRPRRGQSQELHNGAYPTGYHQVRQHPPGASTMGTGKTSCATVLRSWCPWWASGPVRYRPWRSPSPYAASAKS